MCVKLVFQRIFCRLLCCFVQKFESASLSRLPIDFIPLAKIMKIIFPPCRELRCYYRVCSVRVCMVRIACNVTNSKQVHIDFDTGPTYQVSRRRAPGSSQQRLSVVRGSLSFVDRNINVCNSLPGHGLQIDRLWQYSNASSLI